MCKFAEKKGKMIRKIYVASSWRNTFYPKVGSKLGR